MKALKPATPRAASSSRRSRSPPISPPQSAKSTRDAARAAATLASNAAPSTVGGLALSGISTQAVAPPAARRVVLLGPGGPHGIGEPHAQLRVGRYRGGLPARVPVEGHPARVGDPLRLAAQGGDRLPAHRVAAVTDVEGEPGDARD